MEVLPQSCAHAPPVMCSRSPSRVLMLPQSCDHTPPVVCSRSPSRVITLPQSCDHAPPVVWSRSPSPTCSPDRVIIVTWITPTCSPDHCDYCYLNHANMLPRSLCDYRYLNHANMLPRSMILDYGCVDQLLLSIWIIVTPQSNRPIN